MQPKILITAPSFPPHFDGVANSVAHYAAGLKSLGYDVSVFTSGEGDQTIDGVSVKRFDLPSNFTLRKTSLRGVRPYISAIRSSDADVLIAHCAQSAFTDLALLFFPRTKIYHSHGVSWRTGSKRGSIKSFARKLDYLPYRIFGRSILERADSAIFLGSKIQNDRTFDQAFFGSTKSYTIPNGSTFPILPPRKRHGLLKILVVGICSREKGYHEIADLICDDDLRKVGEFTICTTSNGPYFNEFVSKIEMSGKMPFRFVLDKRSDDLFYEYTQADVLLNLSETECFPLVMADAQNVRLPTICYDTGYQKELSGTIIANDLNDVRSYLNSERILQILDTKAADCAPRTWSKNVSLLHEIISKIMSEPPKRERQA